MNQIYKSATSVLILNFVYSTTGAYNHSKKTIPIRSISFAPQLFQKLKNRYVVGNLMKSAICDSSTLESLSFDNRNLELLPIDRSQIPNSRQVAGAIFSLVDPTPVENPVLIAKSQSALGLLGFKNYGHDSELAKYMSGNVIIPGSRPAAHVYCGFQFGSFAGQLGDGATMYLGEIINSETGMRWELQLKGAGKTPFSRTADGRKVLRSSVREFLASEAIHFLNIPTTRAATCVTSDSTVERDPLYNGSVIDERCTIVSRIAPNFFRFGSFEVFLPTQSTGRAGPSAGNEALKQQLLDHMLLYFPDIVDINSTLRYKQFFKQVVERTARLVALWQSVGFVHGVLNTDNMSIMGLTIDYGPFGFMEHFDPEFVPNGSDSSARYSYKQQPAICKWNLHKFGEALSPFLTKEDAASAVAAYDQIYDEYYGMLMREKFGLAGGGEDKDGEELVRNFFGVMEKTHCDFTDAFVALTECQEELLLLRRAGTSAAAVEEVFVRLVAKLVSRCASPSNVIAALRRKMRIHRMSMQPREVQQLWTMIESNPEEASLLFGGAPIEVIREEIAGEKRKLDMLMAASQGIEFYQEVAVEAKAEGDRSQWQQWVDRYRTRIMSQFTGIVEKRSSKSDNNAKDSGCAIEMMSNGQLEEIVRNMRARNPTFVLRNWIAQDAIEHAEKAQDFSKVQMVLKMLETPFDVRFGTFKSSSESSKDGSGEERYLVPPPDWAESLICTCSS